MDKLINLLTNTVCVLQVCSESMRFEKLMEHFKNEDDNIDFLVQTVFLIFFFFHIQFNLFYYRNMFKVI